MNIKLSVICLLSLSFFSKLEAQVKNHLFWSGLSRDRVEQILQEQERGLRLEKYNNIQAAKYFLLNGNIGAAESFLNQVGEEKKELKLISNRYRSIIAFIKGEYKKSLSFISLNAYDKDSIYPQICLLRVLNLLALEDSSEFERERRRCTSQTFNNSPSNQLWLNIFSEVKNKNLDLIKGREIITLRNLFESKEYTAIWMKSALFLNKEKAVIDAVPSLPPSSFTSKTIREIIGLAYYRSGLYEEAAEFIEDIQTANADNIRGNLNLEEKKYELAFGHFQLALKKKKNSRNALERSLPLSWILGQWRKGLSLVDEIADPRVDKNKKLALKTAFLIRLGQFEKAQKGIRILEDQYGKGLPHQIDLMSNYVSLKLKDLKKLEETTSRACQRSDGLSCWLSMKMLHWENIGETVQRKDQTVSLKHFDLQKLKSPSIVTPLQESTRIDQRDLEELDSGVIRLQLN